MKQSSSILLQKVAIYDTNNNTAIYDWQRGELENHKNSLIHKETELEYSNSSPKSSYP